MFLSNKIKQVKKRMQLSQQQLVLLGLVAASSQFVHAGGDTSFSDYVDWLLGLMQGSLGQILVLVGLAICAISMYMGGWKYLLTVLGIIFILVVAPGPVLSLFTVTF